MLGYAVANPTYAGIGVSGVLSVNQVLPRERGVALQLLSSLERPTLCCQGSVGQCELPPIYLEQLYQKD